MADLAENTDVLLFAEWFQEADEDTWNIASNDG